MYLSNEYATNYLNFLFGKTKTLTAPSKVWIGLSSNNPEDDGDFNELVGGNYGRVLISINEESYPDFIDIASDGSITNTKQINWNKASARWETAKGAAFFDREAGGTPFAYGKLQTEMTASEGAVALIEPGMLKVYFPKPTTE